MSATTSIRSCNEAGKDIIRQCEGLRLKAYLCPAGKLTIGYGHTGPDVKTGMTITEEDANTLLSRDLVAAEKAIVGAVSVTITDNQFSALVSFVFNLGAGNFYGSTLLKKLNANDIFGAADEFLRWNKVNGQVLAGLTRRREAERTLFLSNTNRLA
ncbi:lysozyme [Magnetospirillum fulvum]|uniref:Lysozyme n=1 Tax=Magnetospirillum fulvum MGU-K5 TaxID=1316936 RepID=S9TWC4_MAGFU|nr:lysozyme [Magnetospirillum fulvum]EPY02700.1 Phage-related lysozyme [Magnetospirillum fulvum MGU-K5]